MLSLVIASALSATLMVQDAPAFGIILSDDPEPPAVEEVQRPLPNLPAHALADPFGWERSQCSPYLRGDEPLEQCQVRVRSDLAAVMGDRLPAALKPTAGLEHCSPGNADNNFKVECKPREMVLPNQPNLQDRQCENRPSVEPNGTVIMREVCRPTGAVSSSDGLKLTIPVRD